MESSAHHLAAIAALTVLAGCDGASSQHPAPASPPPTAPALPPIEVYSARSDGMLVKLDLVNERVTPLYRLAIESTELTSIIELDDQLMSCPRDGTKRRLTAIDLETGQIDPRYKSCDAVTTDGERVWLWVPSGTGGPRLELFVNGATLRTGSAPNDTVYLEGDKVRAFAAGDGRLFASAGNDRIVAIDPETGKASELPVAIDDSIDGLAATRTRLYVAGNGVRVYDLATEGLVRTLFAGQSFYGLTQARRAPAAR